MTVAHKFNYDVNNIYLLLAEKGLQVNSYSDHKKLVVSYGVIGDIGLLMSAKRLISNSVLIDRLIKKILGNYRLTSNDVDLYTRISYFFHIKNFFSMDVVTMDRLYDTIVDSR